jgi:hypothetical protein
MAALRSAGAAAAAVLLLPLQVLAAEVELGVELGAEYDTNVLSSSANEQDDFSARGGPRFRAVDETGVLLWELRYWPRYRKMHDLDELSGWDHDAYANLRWRMTPRTTLAITDRFIDYAGFDQILTEDLLPDGGIDTGFELGRRRIRQNSLDATLTHVFTPRHLLEVSGSWYDNRFERIGLDDVTSEVYGADASYLYTWSRRTQIGLSARVTRQSVRENPDLPERDTDYYNISAQGSHEFDPTLRLNVSAGPTWVERDQEEIPEFFPAQPRFPVALLPDGTPSVARASTCPRSSGFIVLDPSCQLFAADSGLPIFFLQSLFVDVPLVGGDPRSSGDLTYFAAVTLEKNWSERYFLTLRYVRDVSVTTEVSGTVRDTFSANLAWLPHERWRITFNLTYEMREEAVGGLGFRRVVEPITVGTVSDVAQLTGLKAEPIDDVLETQAYVAGVFVRYTLSRRAYVFTNLYFTRNELEESVFDSTTKADRFRIAVGIVYTFPRFELPI